MQKKNKVNFSQEFIDVLNTFLNVDVAKVKILPENLKIYFYKIFNQFNNQDLKKIITDKDGDEYGIVKISKYRIVLFYVKSSGESIEYVASEVSEKRILNYLKYLKVNSFPLNNLDFC